MYDFARLPASLGSCLSRLRLEAAAALKSSLAKVNVCVNCHGFFWGVNRVKWLPSQAMLCCEAGIRTQEKKTIYHCQFSSVNCATICDFEQKIVDEWASSSYLNVRKFCSLRQKKKFSRFSLSGIIALHLYVPTAHALFWGLIKSFLLSSNGNCFWEDWKV